MTHSFIHLRAEETAFWSKRAFFCTICMIIFIGGCDQRGAIESKPGLTDDPAIEIQASQVEMAGMLIGQLVEQTDGRHVAVEINERGLRSMVAGALEPEDMLAFGDPLITARLFAPHLGLPADAEFILLSQSKQAEDASGLFIAVVEVNHGGKSTQMRLISEPDDENQPTIWVLNDFRR